MLPHDTSPACILDRGRLFDNFVTGPNPSMEPAAGDLFGVVFAVGTDDVAVHHGRPRVPRARSLTLLADMLDDAHTALWSTLVIGPPPCRTGSAAGDACHPSTRGYERLAALVSTMALRWLADLCVHGERARA
ncbi:MAG: hypothetical protein ACRDQG_13830, partial [Pseudonocardiaceae bacterium]